MPNVDMKVEMSAAGSPLRAVAMSRIEATVDRVWNVVSDVDKFPDRVPMISKVKFDGKRATVGLKFKVAVVSVGFEFVVDVLHEEKKWVELAYYSGEPKGIRLRFDLEELDGGKACLLKASGEFDPMSLGWLAKYFLKNHPEIQQGIIPGVAIGLLESMRAAAQN